MKTISKQLARDYVKDPLNEKLAKQVASAKRFDVGAAEVLALCPNPLSLWSLERLSEDDAKALALHKGGGLLLEGLPTISDKAAKSLAQYSGRIYLGGLKKLSTVGAAYLAGHPDIHFPFELRPEAAQGLLEAAGLKHTAKRVAIKSKKLKSLQIALPLEKRPLHLLQRHPEVLHLVSEQMIPGALGEQKSVLNRALLQGLGSYLAEPAKPCMSFHFPLPDAVRDLLTDDWDESETALGEWAEKELGATLTFYVDVEDITEGCGTAVGFSKHVFPKCCVTEDELCSKDTLVLWRSIGAEFTITSVSFESEECELDQWEVPPHELSDLFNRALPPEHTMVYFDIGANGLYVLMETKGMERRLQRVLKTQAPRALESIDVALEDNENELRRIAFNSGADFKDIDPGAECFLDGDPDAGGVIRLRICPTLPISEDAAKRLACFKGQILHIRGRTTLSQAAAKALTAFGGEELRLDGVSELSPAAAEELANGWSGLLDLSGLETLCDQAISSYASFHGEGLSVGGVGNPSESAAKALGSIECEELKLGGLGIVSDAAATALARFKGRNLELGDINCISDAGIKALAGCKRNFLGVYAHGVTREWIRWICSSVKIDVQVSLSDATVKELAAFPSAELDLKALTRVSDAVGKALSPREGRLSFGGLTEMTESEAAAIAGLRCEEVHLNGLKSISPAVASTLARARCVQLHLDGLETISDNVAEGIAGFRKNDKYITTNTALSLNGLTQLSDSAANSLTRIKAWKLSLHGLKTISETGLRNLARFDCRLELGIEQFPEAAAIAFGSSRRNALIIDAISDMSDAAIAAIAPSIDHELSLGGLENLTVAAARALAAGTFSILELKGLKTLPGATAKELSNFKGTLELEGLNELSSEAAKALKACKGYVKLNKSVAL